MTGAHDGELSYPTVQKSGRAGQTLARPAHTQTPASVPRQKHGKTTYQIIPNPFPLDHERPNPAPNPPPPPPNPPARSARSACMAWQMAAATSGVRAGMSSVPSTKAFLSPTPSLPEPTARNRAVPCWYAPCSLLVRE